MTFIQTNQKTYTPTEVVDLFSEYVSPNNVEILVNHLSVPILAKEIISFSEEDGFIHFDIGCQTLLKVSCKK